MSELHVSLPEDRGYPIMFDRMEALPLVLQASANDANRFLVVTDENVGSHYLDRLVAACREAGLRIGTHVIPAGESSKSHSELQRTYDWALANQIDRQTMIVALGGGVVGDLAGYAAATLLRGLPLVQIPSSLIAQVDSSIGGKTGINHAKGKNLIGAFHQPQLVLTDTSLLSTLSDRDYFSGLAEVVKHGLIADRSFVRWLDEEWSHILERDEEVVSMMVQRAAAIKVRIVEADEREHGIRTLLNFGHTFGHALEQASGYGTLTHGEAVAIGMKAALHLSTLGPEADTAMHLINRIPLSVPPSFPSTDELMNAMHTDKKRHHSGLKFVILSEIGSARVVNNVADDAIREAWSLALESN